MFWSTQEHSWQPFSVITSSSSLVAFPLSVSLSCRHVYIASASQYPSRTCSCARLLIVPTKAAVQIAEVRLHNNNACDIIVAMRISGDAQIYKDTNVQMQKTVERYVGWSCVLNCFTLSSLPCFPAFADLLSLHPYGIFQSCLIWHSQASQGRKHACFETVCVKL